MLAEHINKLEILVKHVQHPQFAGDFGRQAETVARPALLGRSGNRPASSCEDRTPPRAEQGGGIRKVRGPSTRRGM